MLPVSIMILSVGWENRAGSTYLRFRDWRGVEMWTELSTDAVLLVQKPISNRPSPALPTSPKIALTLLRYHVLDYA
jgi:hypothetical protein